jgi:hypothetical protein
MQDTVNFQEMNTSSPHLHCKRNGPGAFIAPVKSFAPVALSLLCSVSLRAQELQVQQEADITKELPIPSSVFIPPPPPREVPPMKVESVSARIQPTHRITVIRSEASTLPDIPPPPQPKPVVYRPAGEPRHLLSYGATVYDHRLSHVKWFDPRTKQNYEAWCAWDWTLLSPIPFFQRADRKLSFHLSAYNLDTNNRQRFGTKLKIPAHPELKENTFVITKGEPDDEIVRVITDLRDYYLKHKERLILIQKARADYQAASAAWHAANPPKPYSHTFWLKPHRGSRYLTQEGGAK